MLTRRQLMISTVLFMALSANLAGAWELMTEEEQAATVGGLKRECVDAGQCGTGSHECKLTLPELPYPLCEKKVGMGNHIWTCTGPNPDPNCNPNAYQVHCYDMYFGVPDENNICRCPFGPVPFFKDSCRDPDPGGIIT